MAKIRTFGTYSRGRLWGRSGYSIAIGIEDARFYFGNLTEAKSAACKQKGLLISEVKWTGINNSLYEI